MDGRRPGLQSIRQEAFVRKGIGIQYPSDSIDFCISMLTRESAFRRRLWSALSRLDRSASGWGDPTLDDDEIAASFAS
jgi:hypothetical protein